MALNLLRFFEDESCGQCTPCRVGTEKAVKLMSAPRWDEALLDELTAVMGDASICGLGQAAMNPVKHGAEAFPRGLCHELTACRRDGRQQRSSSSSTATRSRRAPGETIWQVAQRRGTEIPHLCYCPKPGYRADGNCRACMVEIEGERVLAASCIRKPDRRA